MDVVSFHIPRFSTQISSSYLTQVRRTVIREITRLRLKPLEKIRLALDHKVPSWLLSGYEALVKAQIRSIKRDVSNGLERLYDDLKSWESAARIVDIAYKAKFTPELLIGMPPQSSDGPSTRSLSRKVRPGVTVPQVGGTLEHDVDSGVGQPLASDDAGSSVSDELDETLSVVDSQSAHGNEPPEDTYAPYEHTRSRLEKGIRDAVRGAFEAEVKTLCL